jgi:hypothetical protein
MVESLSRIKGKSFWRLRAKKIHSLDSPRYGG